MPTTVTVSDTVDYVNLIRNAYHTGFNDLTGSGQTFEGFGVAKWQDPQEGYIAPGITLELAAGPSTDYGFGDHREVTVLVRANLVFKESHSKTVDGTLRQTDDLAQWYLVRVLDVLDTTGMPAAANETGRSVDGHVHSEPMEGSNLWLYGCIATAQVTVRANEQ